MAERDYSTLAMFWKGQQEKLKANEHKPGWREDGMDKILTGFFREVTELRNDYHDILMLRQVILQYGPNPEVIQQFHEKLENFRDECYDVANFSYFLWDIAGFIIEMQSIGEEEL